MSESGNIAVILITFGGLFVLGLLADLAGRHSPLPRVTLLLVAGFVIGPSVLDWLPDFSHQWFPVLTDIALALIGFLLGQNMTLTRFRELGRPVIAMSLGEVVMTALLVFSVLAWFGVPVEVALLLAGIAPATAPAATVIEWPFLILFFLLAGAALHMEALAAAGMLAGAYIGLRLAGRLMGTRVGGWLSGADPTTRHWIGLALLPQAGVAVGMALLAGQSFPELRDVILPVVLGSTVIFEILGPVVTRWTLTRVGDIGRGDGT